jgi:hypothetical protein
LREGSGSSFYPNGARYTQGPWRQDFMHGPTNFYAEDGLTLLRTEVVLHPLSPTVATERAAAASAATAAARAALVAARLDETAPRTAPAA